MLIHAYMSICPHTVGHVYRAVDLFQPTSKISSAIVPVYQRWHIQLSSPQVTIFTGKAAVPLGGIFGFQKAFFLHPETDELCGRVQLQKGPLGNALYPLYYKASVEPSIIAGTLMVFAWS